MLLLEINIRQNHIINAQPLNSDLIIPNWYFYTKSINTKEFDENTYYVEHTYHSQYVIDNEYNLNKLLKYKYK